MAYERYLPVRDARAAMLLEEFLALRTRFPSTGPTVMAAIWGGPPARVDEDGAARLSREHVEAIARDLQSRDELWLHAAYAREQEHIGGVLDEAGVVEGFALLQTFFESAASVGADAVISWQYR
jgi:hypothetical protein